MKREIKDSLVFVPGVLLILLGVGVVIFPMLLVALVSAALILAGIAALSFAHRTRLWLRGYEWRIVRDPAGWEMRDWLERAIVRRRW